ncbi:2Fe-2S iron-sulfur cluster-binding protein [Bdellovibrio sp. 22V]|uniref:2Fe-2S iron-sulfur cluster-binding protein n=1 Tax=Bdellovibrio sp. 22V TaxID=3044166 RepID=UPI002542DE7B|nr:2Fe-2S iron-sulfur cluster-binding protein [Bdellovibrio sp. 22V]WII71776.1 2Fe-2S iron-sulfur cluster-binding protein [Bdellovibrio sp. 22V]
MRFKAKIIQTDSEITVEADETLLAAARRQNVPYPFSCSKGNCGACKSRLVAGEIEQLSHRPTTLDDEEKSLGLFLACRTKAKSDVVISWLEESEDAIPAQKFVGQVTNLEALTHDIRRVVVKIADTTVFKFKPGQYVQFSVNGYEPRSYSLANQPGETHLEFFIRLTPGGKTSSFIHKELRVGDSVQLEGPFGNAHLRTDHTGPILAVAGGSGLAPIHSIVSTALKSGFKQAIYFYFGVRAEKELFFLNEMEHLTDLYPNFKFIPVVDQGSPSFRTGRVGEALLQDWPKFEGLWQAYIAGPPPMVDSIHPHLLERGFKKHNIFSDPFYFQNKGSNS